MRYTSEQVARQLYQAEWSDLVTLNECTKILESIENHCGRLPSFDFCEQVLVCAVTIRQEKQWLDEAIDNRKLLLTDQSVVALSDGLEFRIAPAFFDVKGHDLVMAMGRIA